MRVTTIKILSLLTAFFLFIGIVPLKVSADSYGIMTGSGTEANPFIIMTLDHLNAVRNDLSSHYKLGANIDASETASWNSGAGFIPIGGNGNASSQFTGVFDGQSYVISELNINRPLTDLIGLFGIVGASGVVRNVGLEEVSITGKIYIGGLAGRNLGTVEKSYVKGAVSAEDGIVGGLVGHNGTHSIVSNSHATGTVNSSNYVGGLVGRNDGTVSTSYATGIVRGTLIVGGLVGDNEGGEISESYASGSVSGSEGNVGGLVGSNISASVSESYATGAVSGGDAVGGLVGNTDFGLIEKSYATGTVSGINYVGGLVGNHGYGTINDTYATGTVSGTVDVGGLVGVNSGALSSSFWDTQTTGWGSACGNNTGPGTCTATGLTTTQALTQWSYFGWDFTHTWMIEEGIAYPLLQVIDLAPPTISISMKTADGNDYDSSMWTNQDVTVTASAYDAKSGLASFTYSTDGETWNSYLSDIVLQEDGVHTLLFKAVDQVGNTFPSTLAVKIDKTAPSVSFGVNGDESWGISAQTTVTVTDHFSGLDTSTLQYAWTTDTAIPASGWNSFASGDTLTKYGVDGEWYLHIQALDRAGNVANIVSSRFRLDASAGVLSGLRVSEGTLSPSFVASTTSYTVNVANNVYGMSITPVTADETDSIIVNVNGGVSQHVDSGEPSESLALRVGGNTITLLVTALNGLQQTYTITVTRAVSGTSSGSSGGNTQPEPNNASFVSVDGGTSTFEGGQVVIPGGALNHSFYVTINEVFNTNGLPFSNHEQLISKVIELTKDQAGIFNKEVVISLQFIANGIKKQEVKVSLYWLNEETNEWVELNHIVVDWEKSIVSGATNHFTKFAVIATQRQAEEQTQEQAENDVQFTDVSGHWAELNIQQLAGKGAVSGYPDGTFKPDDAITRAEFTAILVNALRIPPKAGKVFADTTDHWAGLAISSAYTYEFIHGYDEHTFAPDELLTREQMATMIANAMQLEKVPVSLPFTDQGTISTWAQQAVAATVEHRMITGYPDNTMKPKAHATRAEAVTVLLHAIR